MTACGGHPNDVHFPSGRVVWLKILGTASVAGAIIAGACSSACDKPPPCYGIQVGDRFALTIEDTVPKSNMFWSQDGAPTDVCGFGLDIEPDQVLTLTVAQSAEADTVNCLAPTFRVDPFAGWTWTLNKSQSPSGSAFVSGEFAATNGKCSGQVEIEVEAPSDVDALKTTLGADTPNLTLGRLYSGSGPGCTANCQGAFLVDLKRL